MLEHRLKKVQYYDQINMKIYKNMYHRADECLFLNAVRISLVKS